MRLKTQEKFRMYFRFSVASMFALSALVAYAFSLSVDDVNFLSQADCNLTASAMKGLVGFLPDYLSCNLVSVSLIFGLVSVLIVFLLVFIVFTTLKAIMCCKYL